jgi:hypothetical protein
VNPNYESLLESSRALRLAALEQLPDLLDALKEEGNRLIEAIETGEDTAKSL